MAFWRFTGASNTAFPSHNLVARPGFVYDFGNGAPPAVPLVKEGVEPAVLSPWASDPGPATDGTLTSRQVADLNLVTATDTGALHASSNLSDLTDPVAARGHLGLATVAVTGGYGDLSGKPALSTVATSGLYGDLGGKPTIPNWNVRPGVTSAATAANYDFILADTTAGTFAITAPTPTANATFGVKWVAGTVPPTLGGSFNQAYAFTSLSDAAIFVADGTKWYRSNVQPGPDLSAYTLQSDFSGHISQSFHSGGITSIDWNGVAWPASRPSGAGKVLIFGASSGAGNTRPTWTVPGDVFFIPSSSLITYIAYNNFEGYTNGNTVGTGQNNGSGTVLDLSSGGTGSTRTAESNTAGGEAMVLVSTAPAGAGVTSYVGFNTGVGQQTSCTLGTRWISPAALPPANLQLLRTRINNSGTYATAPAVRINAGTGKFEILDAAGAVAWTSTTVFSAAVAYYDIELRLDCTNGHMQGFITPHGSASETVGDMTTAKTTGAHVDEFCCGVLSSLTAGTTQRFDWLRVADVNTRVNQ